jgi:hypothetical protein
MIAKRVLFPFSALLVVSGCLCSDELVLEKVSPDGRHVATVVRRDCGATTSYATHLRISRRWWRGGATYLAVVLEEPAKLDVVWRSATELTMLHTATRVYRDEKLVDGVRIERVVDTPRGPR